jgi:hypothetical protein
MVAILAPQHSHSLLLLEASSEGWADWLCRWARIGHFLCCVFVILGKNTSTYADLQPYKMMKDAELSSQIHIHSPLCKTVTQPLQPGQSP